MSSKFDFIVNQYDLREILPDKVIELMQLHHKKKGEILIRQSESLECLYILLNGKLKVSSYSAQGEEMVFWIESGFSLVGEIEVFISEKEYSSVNVTAIVDSVLIAIPENLVKHYCLAEPKFLRFICKNLSKKLVNASAIRQAGSLSARDKVKHYIMIKQQAEGDSIKLEKRSMIASMLALSVRQLNRELSKFQESGAIKFKNKQIEILQLDVFNES